MNFKDDKKNKFTKNDWLVLKSNAGGYLGSCHHLAGKNYEYLNLILPMTAFDHLGKGHFKNYQHPDKVPQELKNKALDIWKRWLTEGDYQYFFDKGLIYIKENDY